MLLAKKKQRTGVASPCMLVLVNAALDTLHGRLKKQTHKGDGDVNPPNKYVVCNVSNIFPWHVQGTYVSLNDATLQYVQRIFARFQGLIFFG